MGIGDGQRERDGRPDETIWEARACLERGDLAAAEALLRRADARGSAEGARLLSMLLAEHGDFAGAHAAAARARARASAS